MQEGCLNCGCTLMPHQRYCHQCGQQVNTGRLSFRHLGRDLFQSLFNIEKGLFRLLKGLALNPGATVSAYAGGKRKYYINPFVFTGICIAAMLLINRWLDPYTYQPEADPAVLARMADPAVRQLYQDTLERIGTIQVFMNRYMNIVTVLISPYFAFFLWMFFRRCARNMAEITLAYTLFTAFSNLAGAVLLAPWLSLTRERGAYYPLLYGMILLQTLYIAWGMRVFLRLKPGSGYWRVLGVLALAGTLGMIGVLIAYYFYVYRGESSVVLQYL